MTDTGRTVRRSRLLLVGLAALFIGPLAIAWGLYLGGNLQITDTTNKGSLVNPARPLPVGALAQNGGAPTAGDFPRGAWTLYYLAGEVCARQCRDTLYLMRQTHIALGKDADRVRRVLLIDGVPPDPAWLAAEHADLIVVPLADATSRAFAAAIVMPDPSTGQVYLSDPLGNLMMHYPPGGDERRMLEDLKRLLKLSRIG